MLVKMNPLSQEEAGFDEKMRDELSLLQEKVDAGNTESSFPWARYHHLKREEHEYAQRFRFVKRPYSGDIPIENSSAQIQEKGQEEDVAPPTVEPSTVASPASSHAPLTESVPTTTSKKQVVVPTLESLCKGNDEQRREYAAKIDAMWLNIKNQSLESNYRTACVAVYKLAEWLGIVHKGVKSSEWTATLLAKYGISISEALSKYKIAKPPKSSAFREAIIISFAFAERNVAVLAKKNPLPPIYRNIPEATSKY